MKEICVSYQPEWTVPRAPGVGAVSLRPWLGHPEGPAADPTVLVAALERPRGRLLRPGRGGRPLARCGKRKALGHACAPSAATAAA